MALHYKVRAEKRLRKVNKKAGISPVSDSGQGAHPVSRAIERFGVDVPFRRSEIGRLIKEGKLVRGQGKQRSRWFLAGTNVSIALAGHNGKVLGKLKTIINHENPSHKTEGGSHAK